MRSITVTLDVDETARSIRALFALAGSLPTAASLPKPPTDAKMANAVAWFKIYPEAGNNIDVTNGPARIGFDNQVSRVVATQHGLPLLPGIEDLFPPAGGGSQVYNFDTTYISGKTGDQFQILYGQV